MSWKETCAMDERTKFIDMLLTSGRTMTEVCKIFNVSRKRPCKTNCVTAHSSLIFEEEDYEHDSRPRET